MEPSTLTPALIDAIRQKAKKVKAIIAQSKQVKSTRNLSENDLMRRVIRRPLGAMCPGGRVRILKTVVIDPIERITNQMRAARGLEYDESEPKWLVPDVRDEVVKLLATVLLAEYHERQKTSGATTADVPLTSPRSSIASPRGTRT
jgi:hypothetical protein